MIDDTSDSEIGQDVKTEPTSHRSANHHVQKIDLAAVYSLIRPRYVSHREGKREKLLACVDVLQIFWSSDIILVSIPLVLSSWDSVEGDHNASLPLPLAYTHARTHARTHAIIHRTGTRETTE